MRDCFANVVNVSIVSLMFSHIILPSLIHSMRVLNLIPLSVSAEVITTTDEWGRFPVTFSRTNVVMEGYAALDLLADGYDFSYGGNDYRNSIRRQLQTATGLLIQSTGAQTSLSLSFQGRVPGGYSTLQIIDNTVLPNVNQRLEIGASPTSALAQSVSSFLISPTSATRGMIVFDPDHPEQYAFENQIFYARQTENPDWGYMYGSRGYWGVNTAIRFAHSDRLTAPVDPSIPFIPCNVGSRTWRYPDPEPFYVPAHVIREFARFAEASGIQGARRVGEPSSIYLNNVDDSVIASLPTLQYIVQTEDGQEINVVNVEPHQYIVPTNVENQRQVLLAQARIQNFCTFNKPLRDRMVIHFDAVNQRIGFGEPLVEL